MIGKNSRVSKKNPIFQIISSGKIFYSFANKKFSKSYQGDKNQVGYKKIQELLYGKMDKFFSKRNLPKYHKTDDPNNQEKM